MSMIRRIAAVTAAAAVVTVPAVLQAAHHDPLGDALAGAQRSDENRARDAWRHPRETLEFFGFRAELTVVEIYPGGGWYTEILAPAVRGKGKLIAAHYGENTGSEYRTNSHREFVAKLAAEPASYDEVEITAYDPADGKGLTAPASADLIVTFRNLHGLARANTLDRFFEDAFAALKPGGMLGVVQHRAPEGFEPADGSKGYLPQSLVIARGEAAGFRLDASSEINANPKDTADHPEGVWTLPPALRLGDTDREKYLAIGESDRMTLRFVKPAG
jgi:predicted methyltransferase